MRRSKYLALALAIAAALAALLLTSCVSFPIPPVGDDAGRYGYIDITVKYRPNFEAAWSAFRNRPLPKPTSSK